MKTLTRNFESFDDFVDHIATLEPDPEFKKEQGGKVSSEDEPSKWNGDVTFDKAVENATIGWPEGRERFSDKILEAVAGGGTAVGRASDFDHDVQGFRPDVALYCAGDPAHMLTIAEGSQITDRVVKIKVNLAASFSTPAETLENWGSALCLLVDNIENQGQSVELIGAYNMSPSSSTEGAKNYSVEITLKRAGEPLDIDRLAVMIAHPGTFRRLIFRMIESEPTNCPYYNHGYGRPRELKFEAGTVIFQTVTKAGPNKSGGREGLDNCIVKVKEIYETQITEGI